MFSVPSGVNAEPLRPPRVGATQSNKSTPRSTLLMLVCAFGGYEHVMTAYREAVKEGYRFYSYGDAMLVV